MVIGPAPICFKCRWFNDDYRSPGTATCKAFPRAIPRAILFDGDKHDKPYKGDHGIQFEAKK